MKINGRHARVAAVLSFAALAGVAHADWFLANSNADNIYVSQTGCAQFTGFLPTGDRPQGVAVSPDGSRIYVANYEGSVTVIDARSHATLGTVRVTQNTVSVAATATRIYSVGAGRLDITDAGTLTNVGTVFVPGYAMKVVASRDGSRVFVASSGYLTILDTATHTPSFVALDPNVMGPRGFDASPNGQRVYIARGGNIDVVDTATNSVVDSIPIPDGGEPMDVAVNVDGTRLFVAVNKNVNGTAQPGQMMVFDTASNALLATRATGRSPSFIAANRSLIYVSTTGETGAAGGIVSTFWTDGYGLAEHVQGFNIPAGVAAWDPPVPAPVPNVEITGVEVTQGINDLAGTVRLVAGRRTFARVHVRSTNGQAVPNVSASLSGTTTYCTQGQNCIDVVKGTLQAINKPNPTLTIVPTPQRGNSNASFLFELPWNWVTSAEPLKLYPALAGNGASPPTSCQVGGPVKQVYFELGTELNVQFVRMKYPFGDGAGGAGYLEASKAQQDEAYARLKRFFPISEIRARPALVLQDDYLARWVSREAEGCKEDWPADRRNECPAAYVAAKLGTLRAAWGGIGQGAYGDADGAYGLIPPAPAALDPDKSKFGVRGQCCANFAGASDASVPETVVHETGHMMGRDHPAEHADACGQGGDLDPNYPHSLLLIHPLTPYDQATGLAGFDPGQGLAALQPQTEETRKDESSLVAPGALPPFMYYDIMGYCRPRWTSDYTYNAVYLRLRALRPDFSPFSPTKRAVLKLPTRKGVPTPGDWLIVSGAVRASGGYAMAQRVASVVDPPVRVAGAYAIRLLGNAGAVLADYPFTEKRANDTDALGSVFEVVPFVAGTRTVRIVEIASGRVVADEAVSAAAPVVGNVNLAGPPSGFNGAVTLSWSGSDADGDALSYDALITRDNGVTFTPLAVGLAATSATLDTSAIGGGAARIRVVASDGALTGFADSASFTLPDKTPEVSIVLPGEEEVFVGQAVNFEAAVADVQDGPLPAASIVWRAGARVLGTGSRITVSDFAAGNTEVQVTATNSLGLSASAFVIVHAVARPAPGPVLATSHRSIAWQVAPGSTQSQSTPLAVSNAGVGALNFNVSTSDAWLSVNASSGLAPQTLTVSADPSGLANGTLRRAYVKLTVVGGAQELHIPVRLSVGNTHDSEATALVPATPPPMPLPVAAAGNDLVVNEGTVVTLAGTASTVAAGHAANYQWTQLTGTTVTLANAASMSANFTAPRPSGASEVLTFRLRVTDDTGQTATDEVSITVNALPAPPVNPPVNPPPAKKGGGRLEWWSLAVLFALTLWRLRTSSRDSRRRSAAAAR